MPGVARKVGWLAILSTMAAVAVLAGLLLGRPGSRRMARLSSVTLMGFSHTTPPPWPEGNHFTVVPVSTWFLERYCPRFLGLGRPSLGRTVANMHAENFEALSRKLGFQSVQIEELDDRYCLVVDRRIPREWLLTSASARGPLARRLKLRQERPECFREEPPVESLVGTTWTLVDREDPEGAIARLLPGERIRFGRTELDCASALGKTVSQRAWEGHVRNSRVSLSIYDLQGTTYTGMVFEASRNGDLLTLTPRSKVGSDARGTWWEVYEVAGKAAWVRYRLDSVSDLH